MLKQLAHAACRTPRAAKGVCQRPGIASCARQHGATRPPAYSLSTPTMGNCANGTAPHGWHVRWLALDCNARGNQMYGARAAGTRTTSAKPPHRCTRTPHTHTASPPMAAKHVPHAEVARTRAATDAEEIITTAKTKRWQNGKRASEVLADHQLAHKPLSLPALPGTELHTQPMPSLWRHMRLLGSWCARDMPDVTASTLCTTTFAMRAQHNRPQLHHAHAACGA